MTLTKDYSDSYVAQWTNSNMIQNYSCTKQINDEGNIRKIIFQCRYRSANIHTAWTGENKYLPIDLQDADISRFNTFNTTI